jgi:hypothetical protein
VTGPIRVIGAKRVAAEYLQAGTHSRVVVEQVVRQAGQSLVRRVRARASGRPGPRAVTGDYRRSWTSEIRRYGSAAVAAYVGTNKPQGRRLEYGFYGVDSIGRHYRQPPYPHAGPACDEAVPEFYAALDAAVGRLL